MDGKEAQKDPKVLADDIHQEMIVGDINVLRRIVEEHPTTMHIEECQICRASTRVPFGTMICAMPIVDADLQRRTLKEADTIEYSGPLNNVVRFIAQNEVTSTEILDLLYEDYENELDHYLAEDIALHSNVSEATRRNLIQNFQLDI
jgi:hypothetical protein